MARTLRDNVKAMMAAGVPEDEIAAFVDKYNDGEIASAPASAAMLTTEPSQPMSADEKARAFYAANPLRPASDTATRRERPPMLVVDLMNRFGEASAGKVAEGASDIGQGNYSRGARKVLQGAGTFAGVAGAPLLIPEIAAAGVVPTMAGLIGATAAASVAQPTVEYLGKRVGLSEDQAGLLGDVAGVFAGVKAYKPSQALPGRYTARKLRIGEVAADSELIRAIPPSHASPYTKEDVAVARPYISKEKPIESVEDLIESSDAGITKMESVVREMIDSVPDARITTRIRSRVRNELADSVRTDDLDSAMSSLDSIANLDKPASLSDYEAIRLRLNQELKANLKKNAYDRATARSVDPSFRAKEIAAQEIRSAIYGHLDSLGMPGVKEFRLAEGSLIKVRNAAQRQAFAGEKNAPGGTPGFIRSALGKTVNLGSVVFGAKVGGPAGAAVGSEVGGRLSSAITGKNITRDALVKSAFKRKDLRQPMYPTMPTRPPTSGSAVPPTDQATPPPSSPRTPPGLGSTAKPPPGGGSETATPPPSASAPPPRSGPTGGANSQAADDTANAAASAAEARRKAQATARKARQAEARRTAAEESRRRAEYEAGEPARQAARERQAEAGRRSRENARRRAEASARQRAAEEEHRRNQERQRQSQGRQRQSGQGQGGPRRTSGPDPYTVLGVPRTATDAQIRTAYMDLIKQYHPDKMAGTMGDMLNPAAKKAKMAEATARTQAINAAYTSLKKPKR